MTRTRNERVAAQIEKFGRNNEAGTCAQCSAHVAPGEGINRNERSITHVMIDGRCTSVDGMTLTKKTWKVDPNFLAERNDLWSR